MSIDELAQVKSPPLQPINSGTNELRVAVEKSLGLTLPDDLYEFCHRYGSGRFGDTIHILNPYSKSYLASVEDITQAYRELRRSEGSGFVPYEVYPEKPGLFPWGDDVNGHMMFWLTEGPQDQWPIILLTVDGKSERIDLPITTFLAKCLSGNLSCVIWNEKWFRENAGRLNFNSENE